MSVQETINFSELIPVALFAAQEGASLIVDVYNSGKLEKDFKIGDDPVTIADKNAQQLIHAIFEQHFAGICVIGEEDVGPDESFIKNQYVPKKYDIIKQYESVNKEDITIWVDPLDGTRCFVADKVEMVTTLIGIAVKGTPVVGIVYYPFSKECICGVVGQGVTGAKPGDFVNAPKTYGREFYMSNPGYYEKRVPKGYKPIMGLSGCGNVCMKILKGECGSFVCHGTSKWDTCAPQAILQSVGAFIVTDETGVPFRYDKDAPHPNKGAIITSQNFYGFLNPEFSIQKRCPINSDLFLGISVGLFFGVLLHTTLKKN